MWSRMKAISSEPSMKLIGTRTAPRRALAKDKTTYCQQLCDNSAIRSPVADPLARQTGRSAVDEGVQLAEGEPHVLVDEGELVGEPLRGPPGMSPKVWLRATWARSEGLNSSLRSPR